MKQEKIWEYFQAKPGMEGVFKSESRYFHLADQIPSGAVVLNIGVGRGGLEEILIGRGIEVYCLDPGNESIEAVRARLGLGERAKVGFCQKIPFAAESFDVVVMSEVLEHLSDEVIRATVPEVRRVLKGGGVFIGTVPAEENLQDNIVVCPCCGEVFHRWGHVQSFTEDRLTGFLRPGFRTVDVRRRYFGNWKDLNWKGKVGLISKRLSSALGLKGKSENFLFMAHNR